MFFDDVEMVPSQRVRLSTGAVTYRVSGEGPPLILLHGWGGSSRHWYLMMRDLEASFTTYALDLPGHGESPPLRDVTSAASLARVVLEFADRMRLQHFALVGHSFGGAVAVHLAAQHPDRVTKLILTSFGRIGLGASELVNQVIYHKTAPFLELLHPWWSFTKPWQTALQLWLVVAGANLTLPYTLARPFFFGMPRDSQVLLEGYNDLVQMDWRTSLENSLSLGNPALREAMETLTVPVLLLSGHQDQVMLPAFVQSAAETIPGSTLRWIEYCGHVPMIEQPHVYAHEVKQFLLHEAAAHGDTSRQYAA